MAQSHREASRRLFEIAEEQQGFFTTKQAKAAGFAENTHPYHVQVGNWIREHRGIYRLALFPAADRPDLVMWSLWSRKRAPPQPPQGRGCCYEGYLNFANPRASCDRAGISRRSRKFCSSRQAPEFATSSSSPEWTLTFKALMPSQITLNCFNSRQVR